MDFQQIIWLVFCAIAVVAVQSLCLTWVALHLEVQKVTFLRALRVVVISALVGLVAFWIVDLLVDDPFIAGIPAFLIYLGVFAALLRERVGKAMGVWFLSQVLATLCLGLLALLVFAVVTFPGPAQWVCAGVLALFASAACLRWTARSSELEISFGDAFVTIVTSALCVGVWWILGYYVLGFGYWIVIPLVLPIHLLIVKLRLDVTFGKALVVIAGATVATLALSSLLGLAIFGVLIPYFSEVVRGPGI